MTTRQLLTGCWQLDPFAVIVVGAAVLGWVMTQPRRLSTRALSFGAAVCFFALALLSPIGTLADGYLFSAHMLQHLLLVLIVPPLALLGFDALKSPPAAGQRMHLPAPLAWLCGVGAMWLWHMPTLCNAAASNALTHRVQEITLLAMGTAFFWPIVGLRREARLSPLAGAVYLFTGCVACTILGVILTFSPVEICSVFLHPVDRLGVMPLLRDGWGMTAAKDQQIGGLFMWIPACLVYGAGILGLLARWYRAEEREPVEQPAATGDVAEEVMP
jgi:putative membrane protein